MIDLTPGTTVDRYTVVAPIGQGGMASVYHVRHQRLGSDHVLKLLLTPNPRIRERLLLEGQVQARLKHRNVVEVTDVVDLQGAPGLVMELVRGPALDEVLADGRLALDDAAQLVPGILAGVAAAHHEGVVHRDLKPANVLLSLQRGVVVPKVADFGLVKLTADESGRAKTRTGAAMGTPQYMAPEQIQSAKDVDERADIWALGTILYELVRGERAFEGDTHYAIFEKVVRGEMEPLPEGTPARMRRAIEAALQLEPEERPPTIESLWALWSGDDTPLEVAANQPIAWAEDRVERCAALAPTLSASASLASSAGSLDPVGTGSAPTYTEEPPPAETFLPSATPDAPAPRESAPSSGTWVKVAAGGAAGGLVLAGVAAAAVILTLLVVFVVLPSPPPPPPPNPAPVATVPAPTVPAPTSPVPEPVEPVPVATPAPVEPAPAEPVPASPAPARPEPTASASRPVAGAPPSPAPAEPSPSEDVQTGSFETSGGVPVVLVGSSGSHHPGDVPAGTYTVRATFQTGTQDFGTVTVAPGGTVHVRCAAQLSNCSF